MKAIGKYIIIKEIPLEAKVVGGLELHDAHTDDIRYIKGEVVSIGTHVEGVDDGDFILYDRHAGQGIELEDVFYLVIQERDIVLVL